MKKPRIADAMEYIEEDLITEAVTYKPHKHKVPVWTKWMAAAACLCLCVIGAIKIWNPGMGCSQQVRDFLEADGTLYFSTWDDGVYCWNPDMNEPQKLSETGRISKTEAGFMQSSTQDTTLWEVIGSQLEAVGKADVGDALEEPLLIGIYDGYAYWGGDRKDLPESALGSAILRTPLSGGQAEEVAVVSDGLYLNYHMRGNTLYYYRHEFEAPKAQIYARNLLTGQETVLTALAYGDTEVYFLKDAVVISDREASSLYRMDYTGGTPVLLTDAIPQTLAMSEREGKIYYETSFGENESTEFLSGDGFYSENLVSVDLQSGELTIITDFDLGSDKGIVRYTLTELAMTEGGFYFVDPVAGVFYHNFADGTDVELDYSK